MTKVLSKKVTCLACGNIYQGYFYVSFYPPLLTEDQKKRIAEGKLNFVPCPKCGAENEATLNLPEWEERSEDKKQK